MSILSLTGVFGYLKDDMAKARARKSQVLDEGLIGEYADRLVRAKTDRDGFEYVFAELKADSRLKAAEIVAIAQRYNGGGKKPSSKAMALAAISKRFVEIVRFHAKNKVAERVRPW
jgi:hypothetical protein